MPDFQQLFNSIRDYLSNVLHDIALYLVNSALIAIRQVLASFAGGLPLVAYDFLDASKNYPIFQLYFFHALAWMRLLSYFINLRLLFGVFGFIIFMETAVMLPRIWMFLKRMVPFM